MALPTLARSVAVEWVVLSRFFAADLRPPRVAPAPRGERPALPRVRADGVALTLAGFALSSLLGVEPGGWPWRGRRRSRSRRSRAARRRRGPGARGRARVRGLRARTGRDRAAAGQHGLGSAVAAVLPGGATCSARCSLVAAVSAVLANLVNNLPATLILVPGRRRRGPAPVLAVLIGVNVGPNLTYVGSLATLLWRRVLTHEDDEVELGEFVRLGAAHRAGGRSWPRPWSYGSARQGSADARARLDRGGHLAGRPWPRRPRSLPARRRDQPPARRARRVEALPTAPAPGCWARRPPRTGPADQLGRSGRGRPRRAAGRRRRAATAGARRRPCAGRSSTRWWRPPRAMDLLVLAATATTRDWVRTAWGPPRASSWTTRRAACCWCGPTRRRTSTRSRRRPRTRRHTSASRCRTSTRCVPRCAPTTSARSRMRPATTPSPRASSASSPSCATRSSRSTATTRASRRAGGAARRDRRDGGRARPPTLRTLDHEREITPDWLQREQAVGYVTYVDRFAGTLAGVRERLPYLRELGRQLPAPDAAAATRGRRPTTAATRWSTTARSSRRWARWTTCARWPTSCARAGMALCVDVVLNHTAREHAVGAGGAGRRRAALAFYRTFPDRTEPDAYERTLPEVFPDIAPGSFTWVPELGAGCGRRSTRYQWDLDYANPEVFRAMAEAMLGPGRRRRRRAPPRRRRRSCGSAWARTARTSPRCTSCCRRSGRSMRIAAPGGRVQGRGDRRARTTSSLTSAPAATRARSATSPTTTCSWCCCGARWPRGRVALLTRRCARCRRCRRAPAG